MRVVLLAAILITGALAGCTGGSDGPGIRVVVPDDPVTEPFTFTAIGSADSYAWDLGDGLTKLTGKTVDHTFGFTDGILEVRLTMTTADVPTQVTTLVTLGTGDNKLPAIAMQADTNWLLPGETVTFSGSAGSSDPDGDPLYFSWSCFRRGDLAPAGGDGHDHAHGGGGGGVPFGQSGAAIKGTIVTEPLPVPSRTESDFCGAFPGDFTFGTDGTVAGSFTEPGLYTITMLAKDPKSPAVAADMAIWVSSDRPAAQATGIYNGIFQGGSGGQFQEIGEMLPGESSYDQESHSFSLALPTTFARFEVNASSEVTMTLRNSANTPVFADEVGPVTVTALPAGSYTITYVLTQGLQVEYSAAWVANLDVDPATYTRPVKWAVSVTTLKGNASWAGYQPGAEAIMYRIIQMSDTVRIPPELMTDDLQESIENLVQASFEGRLTKNHGVTVLTTNVTPQGDGMIIHGDGAIFQRVKFDALTFKPDGQEVVDGIVAEVVEFGAFVHIGPLDALVHMSQVMNDFVSADIQNERLTGKETNRALEVGENVRARIVTSSLNELSPRESKIGLTMRQPGLGKFEWIDEDRRKAREGGDE